MLKKRKHYLIDDSDNEQEYTDDENDDFEYVKIKKKPTNKTRKRRTKGIMEYINNN